MGWTQRLSYGKWGRKISNIIYHYYVGDQKMIENEYIYEKQAQTPRRKIYNYQKEKEGDTLGV